MTGNPTYGKEEVFDMIRKLDLIGLDVLDALLKEECFLYPSLMMVNFRRSLQFRRCELEQQNKKKK